jgi:hypothetical protein
MNRDELSLPAQKQLIRAAIRFIRSRIQWKPGKDIQHVQTRIRYGHLPATATVAAYEAVIRRILNDESADVYLYVWEAKAYPTIVSTYQNRLWLVMFDMNGVMETAFPPTDPDEYLADPRFQFLGKLEELIR